MGYLVVAHAVRSAPDPVRLSALPSGFEWSLHRDDDADAFFIDIYKATRKHSWPFTSMPPTQGVRREGSQRLEPLEATYRWLVQTQLVDSFDRDFLSLNLMLSGILQLPVCSLCSDDNGLDFACQSESGRLQRFHCECGDLDIVYDKGVITIQPLLVEDGEITYASGLHNPQNGIVVLERNVEQSPLLHLVASKEVSAFLGTRVPPLGLGSFDGAQTPPRKIAGYIDSKPVSVPSAHGA